MRNQTCCFTGHRNIPVELRSPISEILKTTIISCIEQGYLYFGAGGALGFDTLVAQTVLDLKCLYPSIKLILVLPCRGGCLRPPRVTGTGIRFFPWGRGFAPPHKQKPGAYAPGLLCPFSFFPLV